MTTRPASTCEALSDGRRVTSDAPEPEVEIIIVGHAVILSGKCGQGWEGAAPAFKGLHTRARKCGVPSRSEEHTSELQSLMRISYAVFCLKKKKNTILTTCDVRR